MNPKIKHAQAEIAKWQKNLAENPDSQFAKQSLSFWETELADLRAEKAGK